MRVGINYWHIGVGLVSLERAINILTGSYTLAMWQRVSDIDLGVTAR